MKHTCTKHYTTKDNIYNIYISPYTTKSGFLKFHIEIYAEMVYNNSGFSQLIASYNTYDNALINHLNKCNNFELIKEETT
jgi:hypothetical protein